MYTNSLNNSYKYCKIPNFTFTADKASFPKFLHKNLDTDSFISFQAISNILFHPRKKKLPGTKRDEAEAVDRGIYTRA